MKTDIQFSVKEVGTAKFLWELELRVKKWLVQFDNSFDHLPLTSVCKTIQIKPVRSWEMWMQLKSNGLHCSALDEGIGTSKQTVINHQSQNTVNILYCLPNITVSCVCVSVWSENYLLIKAPMRSKMYMYRNVLDVIRFWWRWLYGFLRFCLVSQVSMEQYSVQGDSLDTKRMERRDFVMLCVACVLL